MAFDSSGTSPFVWGGSSARSDELVAWIHSHSPNR